MGCGASRAANAAVVDSTDIMPQPVDATANDRSLPEVAAPKVLSRPTPSTESEEKRLQAVAGLPALQDPSPVYEKIADAVLILTQCMVAGISLIDECKEVFLALRGAPSFRNTVQTDVARSKSLTALCIREAKLVVDESMADELGPRIVFGQWGLSFYAGVTIFCPEGNALGALWVANDKPVHGVEQEALLRVLATVATGVEQIVSDRSSEPLVSPYNLMSRDAPPAHLVYQQASSNSDRGSIGSAAAPSDSVALPHEVALRILTNLKNKRNTTREMGRTLDRVLALLSDVQHVPASITLPNSLASSVEPHRTDKIDNTTRRWLMRDIVGHTNLSLASLASTGESPPDAQHPRLSSSRVSRPTPIESADMQAVRDILDDWDYDIWELDGKTNSLLVTVGLVLFEEHNLFDAFNISRVTFEILMHRIAEGYETTPYHNYVHAADVAIATNFFVRLLEPCLSPVQILSLLFAALVHDFRHPGTSNAFQIAFKTELAVLYNDRSILENYHCSQTFQVLEESTCNIFENLKPETVAQIRSYVVDLILATDLSQHFETLSQFNSVFHSDVCFSARQGVFASSQLGFVMRMIIKCADVSHSARIDSVHKEWSYRIADEFFCQGDLEKERGVTVSAFMDRDDMNVPRSQIGFIKYIVLPSYEAFGKFLESIEGAPSIKTCLDHLAKNLEYWEAQGDGNGDGGYLDWHRDRRDAAIALLKSKKDDFTVTVALSSEVGDASIIL